LFLLILFLNKDKLLKIRGGKSTRYKNFGFTLKDLETVLELLKNFIKFYPDIGLFILLTIILKVISIFKKAKGVKEVKNIFYRINIPYCYFLIFLIVRYRFFIINFLLTKVLRSLLDMINRADTPSYLVKIKGPVFDIRKDIEEAMDPDYRLSPEEWDSIYDELNRNDLTEGDQFDNPKDDLKPNDPAGKYGE
jgi:hypothetical protein